MATNNFEQGLCDLLGEEMYRAFFTDYLKESDHTPDDDLPNEHVYELGGADYLDSVLIEANKQFEQPDNLLSTPSVANHTTIRSEPKKSLSLYRCTSTLQKQSIETASNGTSQILK